MIAFLIVLSVAGVRHGPVLFSPWLAKSLRSCSKRPYKSFEVLACMLGVAPLADTVGCSHCPPRPACTTEDFGTFAAFFSSFHSDPPEESQQTPPPPPLLAAGARAPGCGARWTPWCWAGGCWWPTTTASPPSPAPPGGRPAGRSPRLPGVRGGLVPHPLPSPRPRLAAL